MSGMTGPARALFNLNRLAYFTAVIEAGSFTGAAERLGVTKAVVSQHVARLESELGTTLILRTTRRLRPTQAGEALHRRCLAIQREAEAAFGELEQDAAIPTGTLRVAASFDFGTAVAAGVAAAFSSRYPDCSVEMVLGDARLDLMASQIDLAIRVGWLTDSDDQARRIGSFRQYLVRAPGSGPAIGSLAEVEALPFVAHAGLREPLRWVFACAGQPDVTVAMRSSLAIDATAAVRAAVLAGAGLSVLPDYLIAADLEAGRLEHVLPQWRLPDGGIHVVFPAARFRPVKVRVFVEMLQAAYQSRKLRF